MYCLLIYISWIQTEPGASEFKCYTSLYLIFTRNEFMSKCIHMFRCHENTLSKITEKKLTCCGVCCVSPPTDHYDGTGAIPRGGLARPDAHQPLQPQRCELQRTAANVDVHRAQLCRTYTPHCSQAPTVSWFPRPDLAGPCLGGSPPPGTDCFLISKLIGRQLGILHTVFWVEHKSRQALGSPRA